jgi:predicted RNA-binding Zn ribbon-like protein
MNLTKLEAARALELAVDLVNSWDTMSSPPELIRDEGIVERWLRRLGYEDAADAVTPADVPRLRGLRGHLRAAFDAESDEEAVDILNAALRKARAVPQLVRGPGGGWHFRHAVKPRTATDWVAPIAALALLEVIRGDGRDRFGLCAAAPCCCVYVDRSRNRSRRYCSNLCSDRVSQGAYRRRKRAAAR